MHQDPRHYFDYGQALGIIGRGLTIEESFTDAAEAMFAVVSDLSLVHLNQIITFEFEETDVKSAFVTWLNLLIEKAREHELLFADFRLKREGNCWFATVSGEKWHKHFIIKCATASMLSVERDEFEWQATCVVDL